MSDSTTLEPLEKSTASSPAISDLMNAILDAKLNETQCYRLKSALNDITMSPAQAMAPTPSSPPKERLTSVGVKTPRPESLSPEGKIILKKLAPFAFLIGVFWWAVSSSMAPTPPAAATPATPAPTPPAATSAAPPAATPTPAAVAPAPAAAMPHHRRHHHAAPVAAPPTPTAVDGLPPAPVIDHVENRGSVLHMTWKSLGDGVRYKAYAASNPKLTDATSVYLFSLHRPYMDWTVSSVGAWRYAAVSAIGTNGKEGPMSNAIDTTAP